MSSPMDSSLYLNVIGPSSPSDGSTVLSGLMIMRNALYMIMTENRTMRIHDSR